MQGFGRSGIAIRMKLLGQNAVSDSDLLMRATPVETKRGVGIEGGRLQKASLVRLADDVSWKITPAGRNPVSPDFAVRRDSSWS